LPQQYVRSSRHGGPDAEISYAYKCAQASDEQHPSTALLAIEVSEDSLAKDRGVKAQLYARASIAEYWIVNLLR